MQKVFLVIVYSFIPAVVAAQIPRDIPHQSEPVDFSDPANILLYIGVPVLMVVLYVILRKRRGRRRDEEGNPR